MPSHSGTDFTFHNSLEKIKSFLINSSSLWTCVGDTKSSAVEHTGGEYQAGTATLSGEAARTIYFKCTGYDDQSECWFALYNLNSASSYFTIAVRGIHNYVEGTALTSVTAGVPYASSPCYLPCNNTQQRYYITGDERKITLMVNVDSRPQMLSFGMFLQGGTPTEYPKPMYVGGSIGAYNVLAGNVTATTGSKALFSPGTGSEVSTLYVYGPDSVWKTFSNYTAQSDTLQNITNSANDATEYNHTMPFTMLWPAALNIDARSWGSSDVALFPISFYQKRTSTDRNDVLGEFDGIFYISGNAATPLAVEDVIDIGGHDYIVWRHPILQNANSYCAVRMEN
jgi:hypothetical protein